LDGNKKSEEEEEKQEVKLDEGKAELQEAKPDVEVGCIVPGCTRMGKKDKAGMCAVCYLKKARGGAGARMVSEALVQSVQKPVSLVANIPKGQFVDVTYKILFDEYSKR